MAVPRWNEIVATEEWQGLDDRGKAQVKQRYLSEVGQTPEWQGLAPEQKQRVLTVMDEQGGLAPKIEEPSLWPGSLGEAAGNVADYYRGVPGKVAGALDRAITTPAEKQEEEASFRQWYAEQASKTGLDPNPDAPEHKYDYRAAFRAGAGPGTDGHWPSQFKADDHPNRYVPTPQGILDSKTGEIVRRPPALQPSHPTEAERQREVMGVVPPGESPYLTPEQAAQAGRDLAATGAKMAMGVSKGLTLGAVDVEKGTIGVPFGGKRYQIGPDVRKSLADLGVSPETAGSGLPGAVGDFAGIAGPWGGLAKVFRAGVQGLRGGEAAGTVGRMAETAAAEGLTGATVAAAHEPSPESMTVGGLLAAAASTGIDAVRLRKELLTGIKGSDWWRLRTNKERALTVQNFDNMTVDDLRAAGLSEAVMARKYPQVFERLNRVRGFGSAAEVPRPSHADPAANAPRADAELAIQKADPAAKPVVEIPAGQYPEVKALIPAKSSTVKVGKNVYAFDLPTLKALLRRDSLSEVKKALIERITAGRYGDLLGYGSATTPEQGAVDVAVTRDGEIVTDLPAMKAAEEAGDVAVAGSLTPEEAPEIAGRWQQAVKAPAPPETPAAVVEEAVQTAQEKGLPLKQQKEYLLENIDQAIAAAPEEAEPNASYEQYQLAEKTAADAQREIDKIRDRVNHLTQMKELERKRTFDAREKQFAERDKRDLEAERQKAIRAYETQIAEHQAQLPAKQESLAQATAAARQADAAVSGMVTIRVPGDGTFRLHNDKAALAKFKAQVTKEFPTGSGAAKKTPAPSGKPAGTKAKGLENYFDVVGGPEPWHSNGHVLVKGAPKIPYRSRMVNDKGEERPPLEYGDSRRAVPDPRSMSPVVKTEFLAYGRGDTSKNGRDNGQFTAVSAKPIRATGKDDFARVRLTAEDGTVAYLDQDYYLYIKQHHPRATAKVGARPGPVAFVDEAGEAVASVMPMRAPGSDFAGGRLDEQGNPVIPEPEPRAKPQPAAPSSSGASASAGNYAGARNAAGLEPPPGTSPEDLAGAARTARAQTAKAMAMPEIVELAKALAGGKLPLLQKQLMRNPGVLGLFSHDGHIELKKTIFRDPHVAAAVLAHEVGHFADWLPDRYMKRGNILGRIATLRGYMKSLLEEFPGAKGKALTDADRDRLRKEARRLLREEWQKGIREIIEIVVREEPIFEQSGITPEMVMDIWNGMTARETNPALYDFLARLSGAEKAAIVRQAMKGIVDAALQKLAGVRQVGTRTVRETIKRTVTPPEVTPQNIAKKFKELLAEEIHKRRLWEAEQITEELKTLTMRWNPFDPAQNPKFTKYRFSSVELYAEALSVLMNDPALMREIAPKFNQAFFNYLDRKPAFRDTWEEIQRRLGDETALWDSRFERLDAMFSHGEEGFTEKRQYVGEPWPRRLKIELVDQHAAVLDRLPGNPEVRQAIEDYIYRSAEAEYLFKELAEKVLSPLKESGIGYDWLKRYVFLRRVAGDRSKLANPGGITPLEVPGGLREIERRLGPEKFRLLEESERLFQQVWKKDVVDELVKADIYGPELIAKITSNQTYYTFAPVEYLTKRYGSGVSSLIHAQAGTLEDIADPVVATIIKGMSLLANARRMQAIRAAGKALAQAHPREAYFPGEEDLYFDKNFMAKRAKEPRLRGQGIIRWLDKGEIRELYVPEAVAQTFEKNPVEGLLVTRIISGMTRPFRELFVNKRVGFSVFNIQRDPRSAVKALPKATMLFPGLNGKHPLMPHLLRELPNAFRGVRGYDPHTQELLRNRALIPSVDRTGMTTEDTELERLLLEHGFELPREVRMKNAGPVGRWIDRHPRLTRAAEAKALQLVYRSWNGLMRWLNLLAATGERTTKLGADSYLKQHFPQMSPAERAAIVRHIGSPAFLVKGRLNPITNNLHLFFNPFVQGWRTQGRAVRGDFRAPGQSARQARLEYLCKSVKMDILPKFLMWGASLGVGGVALRELYLRVSDYNKTNYIIVPLGRTKTGKAVALRLPQDEAGRMTTGLLWRLLTNVDSVDDLFSLLDYAADQAPGMNPVLSMLWDLGDFMSGRNPYDRFRGMPAIPDKIFAAQDSRRVEAFLKYLSNKAGGGIVYTFQTDEVEKIKNELETVLGAPVIGDILGRLIIVQDTGLRQDLAQGIREKVEVPKARELLDADEALTKLVNNDPDFGRAELEALIRHPRGIDSKLTRMIARKHGMAYLEALVRAKSVEERAYIVQHMLEHTPKPEKE
jgi:hypothetical protein